ncbi:MAG TPA: hypothetical protein PKA61_08375 [Nitrospira sp.]|nr:hypothetical protein [Nitrospira sp.]
MADIRQSVREYVRITQELLKQGNDLSEKELQSVDAMLQRMLAMLKQTGRKETD